MASRERPESRPACRLLDARRRVALGNPVHPSLTRVTGIVTPDGVRAAVAYGAWLARQEIRPLSPST